MDTLKWDDELTELALRNQQHKPWAVAKVSDLLMVIREIGRFGGGFPSSQQEELLKRTGLRTIGSVVDRLRNFGFIEKRKVGKGEEVVLVTDTPHSAAFFTGKFLLDLMNRDGLDSLDASRAIGHNFILGARESLELCAMLQSPGLTQAALKRRFLNHLVFNNKLNPHKWDILWKSLEDYKIITEEGELWRIAYSPAPLTFYCMIERYLLDANYIVGARVNASDQLRYLNRFVLEDRRNLQHNALGLSKFPLEGWGKYDTWLTNEGFREVLRIGLVHPLSIVKVLKKVIDVPDNPSHASAGQGLKALTEKFIKDTGPDSKWDPPLEGLSEWSRVFGVPVDTAHWNRIDS